LADQIYSDGIGSIVIIGGTVRIDFMILSPNEKETNGQPKVAHLQRIVMTHEGFAHSAEKIQEAAQALSKMGTVIRPSPELRPVETPPIPVESSPPAQNTPVTPPKRPFP